MRNLRAVSSLLLLMVALLGANALAQTDNPQAPNELSSSIAAARCQYTSSDHAWPGARDSARARREANDDTLAQLPRRGPGPASRPRGPMGRPGYPGMWRSEPSARHALIGAVIGAGLGWAVAAKGNASVRATLGIATVGAGLGAAIGLTVPSFPSRNPHWRRWPDDDEEASRRKSARPGRTPLGSPLQTASVDATPSRALPAEDASTAGPRRNN